MNTARIELLIATYAHAARTALLRSLIARDIDRAIAATYSGAGR